MNFRYLRTISIISFLFFILQSPKAQELSLNEALQKTLENNFDIKLSKADLQIAENNNTIGNAGMLPSVSVGATNANRFDNTPAMPDGRTETSALALRPYLSINWTIFKGFALRANKQNLNYYNQLAQGDLQFAVEQAISDIMLAYYQALLHKENLQVFEQLMNLSRDRYQYILEKQRIGTAVTFEVLQLKNAFLSDSSNYLNQQFNHNNALRTLNRVMADTTYIEYQLTDSFAVQTPEYDPQQLMNMLQNNTSLKMLSINQQVLKNSVKMAQSNRYPTLSLNSGADYSNTRAIVNGADPVTTYSWDYYANLSLSYTIFNGGNINRGIKNAKIQHDKGIIRQEDLNYQLANQLLSLYDIYQTRKQLLNVANENLATAQLNLEIANEKFNNGSITSFNYRDIQIAYLNAATTKQRAIYNLIETKTNLLQITGNLISQ